ncbi:hypothetical protein GCM10029992_08360 [Glycomyces albus]
MKRTLTKSFATAGAVALLLAACSDDSGSSDDGNGSDEAQDPVYTEMTSWNACEVLDNLQPITDYMGIVGWGGTTAEGGEPGNSEIGNTLDPDSIGCNGLINLGDNQGTAAGGEITVSIVPTESEDAGASAYEERAASSGARTRPSPSSRRLKSASLGTKEFSTPGWATAVRNLRTPRSSRKTVNGYSRSGSNMARTSEFETAEIRRSISLRMNFTSG